MVRGKSIPRSIKINQNFMILGTFLVLIGVVFFLKNLGLLELPSSFWSFIWPLLLVVIGVHIAVGAKRAREYKHWLFKSWRGEE